MGFNVNLIGKCETSAAASSIAKIPTNPKRIGSPYTGGI
jgi:hypothetical protein